MRKLHRVSAAVLASALGALLLSVPRTSMADAFHPYRREVRQEHCDLRHDRRELRSDWREVQQDRREIRADYRNRDWNELARDRRELRNDWRELGRDRRDLRGDRWDYRHGFGW